MKKMECDVAVVALGLSGLATSIAAAEQGLSVIGFEKMRVPGGAANMGMGPFAVESRLQKKKQLTLTREEAFMHHMEYTHYSVDAHLVHDFFWKSADTIDWLMDMGVDFEVAPYFPKAEWTAHNVIPEGGGRPGPRGAGTMVKRMAERAEQLGVQMVFETPVKKVLMENGRAVGILATDANGEEVECRSKFVAICTGGLGLNMELTRELTGINPDSIEFFAGVPGLYGDGIKMAMEAGVKLAPIYPELNVGVHDNFNHWELEGAFRSKPEVAVNLDGFRFINEEMSEMSSYFGNATYNQPGHVCFEIVDTARIKHYIKYGPEVLDQVHGDDFYERFFEKAEEALAEPDFGGKYFFKADSIEELADMTGINKENLVETINNWNSYCDHGRDLELCRTRYLYPIATPPFYCMKMVMQGAAGIASGGITVNHKLQCLDAEDQVVPGLYACGIDACNIYGPTYDFYLPGMNMAFALNSGRMAAEYMAEELNDF